MKRHSGIRPLPHRSKDLPIHVMAFIRASDKPAGVSYSSEAASVGDGTSLLRRTAHKCNLQPNRYRVSLG
jgi:hypothetical protein